MIAVSEAKMALVVDDEEGARLLMSAVLEDEGYLVKTAAGGAEARVLLAAHGFEVALCDLHMQHETGLAVAQVVLEAQPETVLLMVTGDDNPAVAAKARGLGADGFVTKPFTHNQLVIAIAEARHHAESNREARHERRQLSESRAQVELGARAVHNQRRATTQRLINAAELRHEETGRHLERVGRYCGILAEELGLPQERQELLAMAAKLHDVGKIGIPDEILGKPGKLTEAETAQMQGHAELGHRILCDASDELLTLAAEIAHTHHEWFDGSGYPQGLAGSEIPLEARVAAVADAFDALTSDRVYRPALPLNVAVAEIVSKRGSQFDPDVTDAFLRRFDELEDVRISHADLGGHLIELAPANRQSRESVALPERLVQVVLGGRPTVSPASA